MPDLLPFLRDGRYAALYALATAAPSGPQPLGPLERVSIYWELGLLERARTEVDQARHRLLKEGDPQTLALAYLWLARVDAFLGETGRAAVALEKGRKMLSQDAPPQDRLFLASVRAEVSVVSRDPDTEGHLSELLAQAEALQDATWRSWALQWRALAAISVGDQGRRQTTIAALEALPEETRGIPDLAWRVHALRASTPDGVTHRRRARELLGQMIEGLPPEVQSAFTERWDRARYCQLIQGSVEVPPGRAVRDLRHLSRVIRAMISETDVEVLLRLVVDSMVAATGAEAGLLVLLDKDRVDVSVRREPGGRDLPTDDVPISMRIAKQVAASGSSLCLADASTEADWRQAKSVTEKGLRSVLCVPLRFRERSMGSVFLESRARAGAFGTGDTELAEVLADQAAIALENALLQARAQTDALTDTANHSYFQRRLVEELALSRRRGHPCSVLLLDLDRFKMVNDTYGHATGSALLRQVADLLRQQVRTSDVTGRVDAAGSLVGRYGGDEFEVLLPGTDREGLTRTAERLVEALRGLRFEDHGTPIEVTASLGGATFPHDAEEAQELFLRADEALYAAKRAGRDRFALYEPSAVPEAADRNLDQLLLSHYGKEVLSFLASVLEAGDDLQGALDRALSATVRATHAERGFIVLFEGRAGIRVHSAFNLPESEFAPERFRLSFGVIARLVSEGKPLRAASVATDVRFQGQKSLQDLGLNSFVAVPVPGEGAPLGVLYLDSTSPRKAFTPEDEMLLLRFAEVLSRTTKLATASHARSIELAELRRTLAAGLKDLAAHYRFDVLMGESAAMRQVHVLLDHIVRFPYPVLLVGETGTGKEVVAKAIHANGPRKDQPLVAVNCAALPRELLESELFGHVRGAFTGADRDRPGLFRSAHGGTLFLDEIGETSEELQRKLLRVLQEGEFVPVGAAAPVKCNVRVIAATNRDLEKDVKEGRFRQDLYYRLKVFKVALPPLRERPEDVPLLARHLLDKAAKEAQAAPRQLHAETLSALSRYPWPGNVRELENAMKYAIAFSGEVVRLEHLPPEIAEGSRAAVLRQAGADAVAGRQSGPSVGGEKPLDELWKTLIERTLVDVDWNHVAAAKLLGISRTTLYQKIKAYGIAQR